MRNLVTSLVIFGLLASLLLSGVHAQIPESDAPGEDQPDVPRYPGMVRSYGYDFARWNGHSLFREILCVAYSSTVSGAALKNFYMTEMPQYGWTLVTSLDENVVGENVSFGWGATFQKTGAFVALDVTEAPHLGETWVHIFYRLADTAEIENIPAGGSSTVEFENQIVDNVEITAKATISSGMVRVETVAPYEVPAPLENALYYINLTTDVAENIDKATIRFRVPKSWISENNIDPATVRLWRYTENQWVELPTQPIGEEENFYIHSAETTGFSIFTVTGRRAASSGLPSGLPLVWVGIGSTLIIVAIMIVLGYWKRSRSR